MRSKPLKILALILTVAASTTVLAGSASADEKRGFGCRYESSVDKSELNARAPNYTLRGILEEYRLRWDAADARAQCKAFAEGKAYEIGCRRGRRDWDAIAAMVPDKMWDMSRAEAKPFLNKLKEEDDGYKAAIDYCRDVGAVEKSWSR